MTTEQERTSDAKPQVEMSEKLDESVVEDYVPDTTEEKKLVRKVDMYLMPTIWIMYLLSYMDRTNIGNAKIAGMGDYLDLSDNDYALTINLFQIAYIIFSVPSNMLLSRWRPSLYIPSIMFLWGAVVCCLAAIQTTSQLQALRFLLGMFEAGYTPAVMYMFSSWYRRVEQSKRFLVFWTAGILGSAFGGILAGVVAGNLDGVHGIAGWRWLFMIEGIITVGCAVLAPLVVLDYPGTCKKLKPEERTLAVKRMQYEGVVLSRNAENETHARIGLLKALWKAISTPAFYFLYLGFMVVDGSFSIAYFYPTLVSGLGYDSVEAQFMTAPLFVPCLPVVIFLAYFADKHPDYRIHMLSATMVYAAIISATTAGVLHFKARYALLVFMNIGLYSVIPLSLAYAAITMGKVEPEIRAVVLALVSAGGNLAQIYNSYLWPDSDAPRYLKGFAAYAAMLVFGASVYFGGEMLFRRRPGVLTPGRRVTAT